MKRTDKLCDCNISVKTVNLCRLNCMETLGDLLDKYDELGAMGFLKFRSFGHKALREVESIINNYKAQYIEETTVNEGEKPSKQIITSMIEFAEQINVNSTMIEFNSLKHPNWKVILKVEKI